MFVIVNLQTTSPTNYVCAVLQSISIEISHAQLPQLTHDHHKTKCYRNTSYGCQLGALHSTKIVPKKQVHKFPISCTIPLPPKFTHQPFYQHELHVTELSYQDLLTSVCHLVKKTMKLNGENYTKWWSHMPTFFPTRKKVGWHSLPDFQVSAKCNKMKSRVHSAFTQNMCIVC